jgi:hypothetical protein
MHLSREYNLRKYHEILKEIIYNKSLWRIIILKNLDFFLD